MIANSDEMDKNDEMDRWMDDRYMNGWNRLIDEWVYRWMDIWMDRWMSR